MLLNTSAILLKNKVKGKSKLHGIRGLRRIEKRRTSTILAGKLLPNNSERRDAGQPKDYPGGMGVKLAGRHQVAIVSGALSQIPITCAYENRVKTPGH